MMRQANVLVVDDEPGMRQYLQTLLELDSYQVQTVASGAEALERLNRGPLPDVVLLDLLMPGMDGLQTLEQLRQISAGLRVVMLSCVSEPRKIVQAMRFGAQDYLTKPFQKAELESVLRQCLARGNGNGLPVENTPVEELGDEIFFLAASRTMQDIRTQIAQVAKVNVPVLFLGESGTGKEVLARLLHKYSERAHRSFLKVNCAALPGELLESELFGYEPGAFTGANRSKPGKFELCNHGTILLDEIGEMPVSLQAKLLHVLQDQQFSRLGGRSNISVDVRVLAATNVDMHTAIAERKFREDLYYRLNAFTINVPPLRERKEEIPALLKHFAARFAENYARGPVPLSERLLEASVAYHWPGNLREMENFVKRLIILGDEDVALADLKQRSEQPLGQRPASGEAPRYQNQNLKSLVRSLKDEAEAQAIASVLHETGWNRREAAQRLHISYKALLYKIRQYQIRKTVPGSRF